MVCSTEGGASLIAVWPFSVLHSITLIDKIAYMKAIVIQPTKGNTGFTASVVGMKNYQSIAADEITALKQLVEKLEKKNPKFIIRPEYTEY